MCPEILLGHEPGNLAKNCAARSRIQFDMCRDRESLNGAVGKYSTQLDVAASLGVNGEAEATEDCDHLRA